MKRDAAYEEAKRRDFPRDHRGFRYNPRTGWATLT